MIALEDRCGFLVSMRWRCKQSNLAAILLPIPISRSQTSIALALHLAAPAEFLSKSRGQCGKEARSFLVSYKRRLFLSRLPTSFFLLFSPSSLFSLSLSLTHSRTLSTHTLFNNTLFHLNKMVAIKAIFALAVLGFVAAHPEVEAEESIEERAGFLGISMPTWSG